MEVRPLGRSGIPVSAWCLGTMMFGAWGNTDEAECRAMVEIALAAGVTFFDTADVYDSGRSESILGAALGAVAGRREEVVIGTKFGLGLDGDRSGAGNSARSIARSIDASLVRLGTDWIDLYQIHRPDPLVPIAETIGAMDELVRAGKIRAYGTSTFPADELAEVVGSAREASWVMPATEQPPYSLLVRGVERDVFATCQRHGIGAVTWAPLNGGWLTGKYRTDGAVPPGSRAERFGAHIDVNGPHHTQKAELVARLGALARQAGIPLLAMALAFAGEHPAVSSVILGPKRPDQLTEMLTFAGTRLSDDVLDAIDEIVPPGRDVNPADAGYERPSLDPAARRRGRVSRSPAGH